MSLTPFLCLDIPDLEIQLLQRKRGLSPADPLLVVERDRPTARVCGCNAAATALGVAVGMRYAEALSLSGAVTAGVVSVAERQRAVEEIIAIVRSSVPDVEVWPLGGSVFWGDLRGMERLGAGTPEWFRHFSGAIGHVGWSGGVALGWTRPGTFFAAHEAAVEYRAAVVEPAALMEPAALEHKVAAGPVSPSANGVFVRYAFSSIMVRVFLSITGEQRWYRSRRIDPLPIVGRDRDRLVLLGVRRVDELIALREDLLVSRFSDQLRRVHRFLRGVADGVPVYSPGSSSEVSEWQFSYEPPLRSNTALLGAAMQLVAEALPAVKEQSTWIRSLRFCFTDDRAREHVEEVECGRLTRDLGYVERLVALRLEHRRWEALEIGVVSLTLATEEAPVRQGTLGDLVERSVQEDSVQVTGDRVDEAVALLRARLGNERVFRFAIQPGRVPEDRYTREPVPSARLLWKSGRSQTAGDDADHDPAVSPARPELTRIRRIRTGGVEALRGPLPPVQFGPFVQGVDWWNRDEPDRVYSYRPRSDGTVLWGYRAVDGGPWIVQGALS